MALDQPTIYQYIFENANKEDSRPELIVYARSREDAEVIFEKTWEYKPKFLRRERF